MISTLRWVRKITFHFFFLDLLPNSRLDSSLLKTRNLLGVFVGNNIFLRGLGPTSVLYMFSVEGGVGSDEDAKCTQNGSAPRKGHIPCKMRIFSESKGQKKKHNQQSITDEASHASRQPRRTNSDSSTDRRPTTRGPIQIQGRARGTSYRSPTRAPLPRAYTERGRIGAEPSRVTRTLVWCLRVTTSRLERERERASSFRAPFECIDDDDGGPSSPSSRCLGDETTPNSA